MKYFPQNMHFIYWLLPLILLDVILKSIALWKAARNKQLYWFIAILILNTAGILPIIYLLFFRQNIHKKKEL